MQQSFSHCDESNEFTEGKSDVSYDTIELNNELEFQTFAVNEPRFRSNYSTVQYLYDPNAYAKFAADSNQDCFRPTVGSEFEDEPPLLEELGINPDYILQKTLTVLNPLRSASQEVLNDTDMTGPLAFCLAFAGLLMLRGKVIFSYVYGIGALGSFGFYFLLYLMATETEVTFSSVISVLGYCLLPMVLLAASNVVFTLTGMYGLSMTAIAVLWCSLSASKWFVTAYSMKQQQWLVAYPCAMFYGVFALLTVF